MKKIFTLVSKASLLTICFLIIAIASFSQTISQYTFSTVGTGSLALDRNGNTVDMSTGTTLLIDKNVDDGVSGITNTGFPFAFMSTGGAVNIFTQFSASSNGLIRLGSTAVSGTTYGNGFPPSSQDVIAPYLQDLSTSSSTGKVHYKLIGSYPNRTLVIEFLNMNINYASTTADGTFQVRLYEQTNVIEFVYGAMKVGSTSATNSSSNAEARNASIGFSNTTTTGNTGTYYVNQTSYATSTSTAIVNNNNGTGIIAGLNSSANGARRVFTFIPTVPYKSQFISMNIGSTTWCAGETRNVTVKVKNIGTATWTNASPDINVGIKWNTNGTSWADYYVRVDANGLVPGDTGTYILPITASNFVSGTGYTSSLPAGTNNLTFDIVEEAVSWLGDNGGNTGPGNIVFKSDNITINTPPSVTTQPASKAVCAGSTTSFTIAATGTSLSYQWQLSTDNGVTWNNLSNTGVYTGTATNTLNISNVTGLTGYQYRVAITSSGACSVTSGAAILIVNPLPTASISYAGSPYCSNGGTATVTQTGTTGGTYSSTTGLSIIASTGAINLSASTPATYTVTYSFSDGTCPNTATTSVTITALPVATFSYAGTPYCQNASNPSPAYSAGGAAGTFSSTAGLVFISTSTGQVNLSASTAGTYTVTNTRTAANGCSQVTATSNITITVPPSATISYTGSPYCKSLTSATIAQSGTAGGTYTSTTGLSINTTTGEINPSTSTAGTYTVTYTVAAANGCSPYTTMASVTITAVPVATFSYTGTPYCQNAANPSPTFSGGGAAGTFSSTTGLVFVSTSTGQVNLSASTSGTYTVTNTRAAANGCSQVTATSNITVTATPSASISYTGSPYCSTGGTATVSRTGTAGGSYSSTTGLVINSSTGDITLASSTAGTYTVTYTVSASGGCATYTATALVTINAAPTINSGGQPANVTTCAGTAKTFTVSASGTSPTYQWQYSADGTTPTSWSNVVNGTPLNITYTNATTNILTVTPNSSSADGVYYYRCVVSVASCSSINSTAASLTVNALPTAVISYAGSPYCLNAGTATVTRTGTTGGTYSASPAGLVISSSTGAITLGSSTAGTYTVTYSFSNSSTGCSNSTTTTVTLNPIPVGVTASASPNPVCAGSTVALTSLPSAAPVLTSQNFNSGIGSWTRVNNSSGGTVANAAWTIQNDGYTYGGVTFHSNDNSQFVITNSDAQGSNQNYTITQLISPSFSTVGLSSCALSFYQYLPNDFFDFVAAVDISTDGGSSWTEVHDYINDGTIGSATSFQNSVLSLNSYLGYSAVKIRFEFRSFYGLWWALDNINIIGGAIGAPYTYAWTSTPAGFAANTQNTTAMPTANTTYNIKVTNSYNCAVSASTPLVTINPKPTAILSGTQTICNGTSANLSIAFTGTAPFSVSYTDGTNTYVINNINTNPFIKTVSPTSTTTYNLTVLSTGDANCSGGSSSGTAVVTVNQRPSITGTYTPTICSGSTFTVTPTSTISGTTYTWAAPTYSAASITGGANQTTGITTISGTLNNSGINGGTATYTVTPSAGNCPGNTFTVTPTVAATLANTIVSGSTSVCSGTGVIITFSGAAGSTLSYKKNGTAQTDITLNSSGNYSLTVPFIIENTTYQLTTAASTTNSNTCTQNLTSVPPAIVTLSSNVLWTGNAGTINWSTGGNWCSGSMPVSGVDVTIGSTNGNYPTLPGNITVANLTINTNNILTLGSNALTVTGAVSGAGSITGSAASSLTTAGNSTLNITQTTPGTTNVLRNLSVTAGTLTLGNALDITGGTNYGVVTVSGSGLLAAGNNLTLKSDNNGTAAIGQGAAAGGYITGNVTVERYTDGATTSNSSTPRRAWRLMTSPIGGQTIRQAWQENGVNNTGYGTLITGENIPDAATAAAQGYDFTGAGFHASIKRYVPAATSGSWIPLANGTNISVRNEQAYMLFVRGDRTVGANVNSSSVATLRANGTLLQGTQPAVSLSGGKYTLMGNPYASSIDFSSLYGYNSAVIANQFYLWNSKLGTYGAYILVNKNGSSYQATPSPLTGTGTASDDAYRYIPSGSGFFVSAATGVTSGGITIREADKTAGSVPPVSPFRVVPIATDVRQFIVNLNLRDSVITLADGFRALFSADYEGNEEDNSSGKIYNFNENLNLVYGGKAHIVEARGEVKKTDTLYMKMWFVTKRSYQLQMKGDNFASAPGIKAWLEDTYLATKQELALGGDITTINFEVNNDSASSKSDRFRIVFENNTSVLPVTITKVSAQPKNGGAEVNWTVANETNIKGYTVEKSTDDGRTFMQTGTQQAAHNNPQAAVTSYAGYDATPKVGDNLYRIRIEGKDGKITYSEVVKVTIGANGSGIQITLYPNPVKEGKANLQLTNLKEGTYLAGVFTGSGQTVYQKKVYITLSGTTQTEALILGNNLAQGSYQIKVTDNKGNVLFTDKLIVAK